MISIKYRKKRAEKIKSKVRSLVKDCPQKDLALTDLVGKGDYGNVYKKTIDRLPFAVKISKLKKGCLENPYCRDITSWTEFHILDEVIAPLLEKGVCPNLPLLIDSYICEKCTLTLEGKSKNIPCITTIVELADGTLKTFLKSSKTIPDREIFSALFQIMASLHCIQLHGQIMNFDIKCENVLYYKVKPGGYWHYKIRNKDYYVPNYGKMFFLNDFGVSRPLSPDFQLYRSSDDTTYRLGTRLAIIRNGLFWPLGNKKEIDPGGFQIKSKKIKWITPDGTSSSRGGQYRINRSTNKVIDSGLQIIPEQREYLRKKGLTDDPKKKKFFSSPEVIPPFEFYNDLQDALRMFTGGKRTTQVGSHKTYKSVSSLVKRALERYTDKKSSLDDLTFSIYPSRVLAGYFIESFFKDRFDKKGLYGVCLGDYTVS